MKLLIIEDESAAARRLQKLIAEINPGTEVLDVLDSIDASTAWLQNNPSPDLIFMDIQLADGPSFNIFNEVNVTAPVVFITAYDEYAIQAFKVNAIDYLLKPVKTKELQTAFAKYYDKYENGSSSVDYQELAHHINRLQNNKRFLIRLGQQMKLLEIKDAAYFYTQDKITFLQTYTGRRYPVDYSLEKLEELVDGRAFFRINRQFIINIDAISEMYAYSKSRVKLILNPPIDESIIVSTERSPHFKKWLTGDT